MKKFLVAGVMVGLVSFGASAAQMTLDIQGSVSYVDSAISSEFNLGDSFSMMITFDSPAVATSTELNTTFYADAITEVVGSVESYNFIGDLGPTFIYATNGVSNDIVGFRDGFSGDVIPGMTPEYLAFDLLDASDSLFTSDPPALFSFPGIDSFDFAFASLVFRDSQNASHQVAFSIDSMTLSDTVVPEPATMTLLGLGLGAMAYTKRRRKA